jgi:hypothetical protein
MPLTFNETLSFFGSPNQMAMEVRTMFQRPNEGITTVEDLLEFDEESLKQVVANLRRPAHQVPNTAPGAAAGSTMKEQPFVIGAKSQTRLIVATELLKFYDAIGRVPDAGDMMWNNVMRNFREQWKAIKDSKKESHPTVPVISKALPIIRWIEAFQDHCYRCIGVRHIPLAYVIREDAIVPAGCPDRATDQPYSQENGSILGDLIMRGSHTHGLFREDNAKVYFKLEEATRGTPYVDSIKPFQRAKDGRRAFIAMVAQYAGLDKWEAEIKKATNLLMSTKWKGTGTFPLDQFVAKHRNAYVSLEACATHVEYQLPNAHSRVGYILDAIETDDAPLQAAMANILDDTEPGGKRGDFEAAVAYLSRQDPVVKRRTASQQSGKRNSGEISDVKAEVSDFGSKPGIGKSGVHLRYYQTGEYNKLNKAQKQELRDWREKNPSAKGGGKMNNSPNKKPKSDKAMAAAIKKGVDTVLAEREKEAEVHENSKAVLKSLVQEVAAEHAAAGLTSKVSASTGNPTNLLKSIIKKAGAKKTKA